jgi:hypothetical protein
MLRSTIERAGETLSVAIEPPTTGETFDLLATIGETFPPGSPAEVMTTLARASHHPGVVAVRGFALRMTPRPLMFTLAIALTQVEGEMPDPETIEDGDAESIELPVGDGIRISRRRRAVLRSDHNAEPVLTVQYLIATDFGGLAMTFATPHVDGQTEFTLLFDKIARSCRITPV